METVRLLLVEDNPADTLCLKDALQEPGGTNFSISHVETLAEAKDCLQKEKFDILVLDLGLPDGQGLETFVEVRDFGAAIPIVVLSGLDDETLAIEAVRKGAQDYLLKGKWDGEVLKRAIHYAIERHRLVYERNGNEDALSQVEAIRLLVVEDNLVDALFLKEALEASKGTPFTICHVQTLTEAKESLETGDFNIVVLDLGLPDSQGIQTLLEIKNSAPDIPIVVLSGLDDETLAMEAVKTGAQDYLLKDKLDGFLLARSLNYAIERQQSLIDYRRANDASLRANRALRVLSACNQLLIRATEEQRFLDDVCRILVDPGGYRMAWIGYALQDKGKTVQPVAVGGFEDGYLDAVKITWSNERTGQGPTGTAIRTGKVTINRNSVKNPIYTPWRAEALKRGYYSSIALPLTGPERIFGALTIYADDLDAFDDEEVTLLGQFAADLAYGIKTIRMRGAKEQADQALRESEQRFRAIFEGAEDPIFLKDRSLRYTQVNPAFQKLVGIPASEILGKKRENVLGEEASDRLRDMDLRVLEGETIEDELALTIRRIPMVFLATKTPLREASGEIVGILTSLHDITDRKRIEVSPVPANEEYHSPAMRATLNQVKKVAKRASTILLTGESGTGKDYLARYIHDHSDRANGPYFSINCAAIAPQLAESELFGHEKGSFTGAVGRKRGLLELAEGGTLLLNEIGELVLHLQAKLLTFLDTKKFTRVGGEKEISINARLIAATNRDLKTEVEERRFREDLFYRLNVFSVVVPPLRARQEDIPVLVQELLASIRTELQLHELPAIDREAMNALMMYDWPGNVRELRNVLERAVMLSHGKEINLSSLGLRNVESSFREGEEAYFSVSFPSDQSLNDVSKDLKRFMVNQALRRSGGSRQGAAKLLGISRYSLKHYMKSLGYSVEEKD